MRMINSTICWIGSRSTPIETQLLMAEGAYYLTLHGYKYRSGHAIGGDLASEVGAMYALIRSNVSIELWHYWMHVFLPWRSFRSPNQELGIYKACEITSRLKEVTIKLHPAHENLPEGFLPLHARNHQEVMGEHGDDPAKVVLCYTDDGVTDGPSTTNATGGSGQAIRVASLYNIPVKNFQREDDVQWLRGAITFVKEG